LYGGFCLRCEIYFEGRKGQSCCSKLCRTRYQATKRRLRVRGLVGFVIPIQSIYRRDAGRCQLCRKPVHKALRYPHQGSATLDHIIPITKGGQHTSENVQLAHARCNKSKGNRLCGSQLRLVG
jgi:5-methylcytosine-specific restriction endonuclease McrA